MKSVGQNQLKYDNVIVILKATILHPILGFMGLNLNF